MDQELTQYLEERFDRQERRLETRFDRQEERLHAHFERLDERIEEVKRHNGMLIEDLQSRLQLMAEGQTMHLEVRHREDREYFDRKFEDMAVLFRSAHTYLQQRLENHERKPQH